MKERAIPEIHSKNSRSKSVIHSFVWLHTRTQMPESVCTTGKLKWDAGVARCRSPEHWTRSRRGWAASSQAGSTSWWEDSSSPESPFVEAGIYRDRITSEMTNNSIY